MNLCDQCETVSHCTAHGCIPLTECINSGQVSAAQAVAHAEAGEFTTGWPAGLLQDDSRQLSKALSRDPNARAHVREAVAHQEAGELPEPFGFLLPTGRSPAFHYMRRIDEKGMEVFTADQMRDYAEAARREAMQEAERYRAALTELRLVVPYFWNDDSPHIEELDAACEKADEAIAARSRT